MKASVHRLIALWALCFVSRVLAEDSGEAASTDQLGEGNKDPRVADRTPFIKVEEKKVDENVFLEIIGDGSSGQETSYRSFDLADALLTEEELKLKAKEEEQKRKAEEEALRQKAEEEEQKRKAKEEELKLKAKEEEEGPKEATGGESPNTEGTEGPSKPEVPQEGGTDESEGQEKPGPATETDDHQKAEEPTPKPASEAADVPSAEDVTQDSATELSSGGNGHLFDVMLALVKLLRDDHVRGLIHSKYPCEECLAEGLDAECSHVTKSDIMVLLSLFSSMQKLIDEQATELPEATRENISNLTTFMEQIKDIDIQLSESPLHAVNRSDKQGEGVTFIDDTLKYFNTYSHIIIALLAALLVVCTTLIVMLMKIYHCGYRLFRPRRKASQPVTVTRQVSV